MYWEKRKEEGQIPRGGPDSVYLFLLCEVEEKMMGVHNSALVKCGSINCLESGVYSTTLLWEKAQT
jgi:hypothetical protein